MDTRWESLGSGLEVEMEQFVENRKKIKLVLRRRLKDFGVTVKFTDTAATETKKNSVDFAPFEEKAFNIHMTQLDKASQVIINSRDVKCQTDTVPMKNIWTQYAPRELAPKECDEILESESLNTFLSKAAPGLHDALEQPQIVDVFVDDFHMLRKDCTDEDEARELYKMS